VLPGAPGAANMGVMPIQRLAVLVAALSFASSALAQPDAAADYPNHPVRIIVSTSAGGGVDTVTRIIAAQLQEKLGQPLRAGRWARGAGTPIGPSVTVVMLPSLLRHHCPPREAKVGDSTYHNKARARQKAGGQQEPRRR
jgi:hypothetical protein